MDDINILFSSQEKLLEVVARMTPQWIAGFFDGEGCVSPKIEHHGTIANVRVSVTQKDPTILSLIGLKFPGGHFSIKNRQIASGKATTVTHELMYTGASCQALLEYIKDHSIVKKEQILLGLDMCKLVTYSGGKLSEAERSKRIEISERIRAINRKSLETTPTDEAVSDETRDARKDG
jgi:hypothetical protein